jgi:NitT/TauT family transport system substrate-binding protein
MSTRVAALSALAAASFSAMRPMRASAQAAREKITVGGALAEDFTPLYYGIKAGLFQRAGLDVEIQGTNSGSAATAAVVAGTFQIAKTSLMAIFNAYLRGIPIVIVFPEVLYTPRNPEGLLQIPVDSVAKTGADLNGKTIGTPALSDLNTLVAKAWVDKNGGDSATLKFVEIPNSAQPEALAQRRIDAAIVQSPALDASLAAGTSKTLADPMGAIAPSYMIAAFIARSDWVAAHTDDLRRFTRTLAAATTYVNAHHAETTALVAELTKIEVANAAKMKRTVEGTVLDPALIQPFIDAAAKYGMIARGFPARELLWAGG